MDKNTVKTLWKTLAREKLNTRRNAVEYCILKAMVAKNIHKIELARIFLQKAFTPSTKHSYPYEAIRHGSKLYGEHGIILGRKAKDIMTAEEIAEYQRIHDYIFSIPLPTKFYSYFFTRQDIYPEYQLVQTAHVALELGNKLTAEQVKNLHFTCCGVENLHELEQVEQRLKDSGLQFVTFREPDIGNEITSIGVYPIAEHKRGNLRKYGLLRFNNEPLQLAA